MVTELPTLYRRLTDRIQFWRVQVHGHHYRISMGKVGGLRYDLEWTMAGPEANELAHQKWHRQRQRGYMETPSRYPAAEPATPKEIDLRELEGIEIKPAAVQPWYQDAIRVKITRDGIFNHRGNHPACCPFVKTCADWVFSALPALEMIEACLFDEDKPTEFGAISSVVWLPRRSPAAENLVHASLKCYVYDGVFENRDLTFGERYAMLNHPDTGVIQHLTAQHPLKAVQTWMATDSAQIKAALHRFEIDTAEGLWMRDMDAPYPTVGSPGVQQVSGGHHVTMRVTSSSGRSGVWAGTSLLRCVDVDGYKVEAPFRASLGLQRELTHTAPTLVGSLVQVRIADARGKDGGPINAQVIPPKT